jgi:hypothetical protein
VQRLVDVGHRQHARRVVERVAVEPPRVARAVELLVVQRGRTREVGEGAHARQDVPREARVPAHRLALLVGQPPRLVEDAVRDAELPDVVQHAGPPQPLALGRVHAARAGDALGVRGDVGGVAEGVGRLGVDDLGERARHLVEAARRPRCALVERLERRRGDLGVGRRDGAPPRAVAAPALHAVHERRSNHVPRRSRATRSARARVVRAREGLERLGEVAMRAPSGMASPRNPSG